MATWDATAAREDDGWVVAVERVGTTRARTLEDAGPAAVDMVAARLAVDPATVRVVVRTQPPEEIADAIEHLHAAAASHDEDPQRYAEANLQARRMLRESTGSPSGTPRPSSARSLGRSNNTSPESSLRCSGRTARNA